jgi:eukaryotic-like serine/threonine-protein kinase
MEQLRLEVGRMGETSFGKYRLLAELGHGGMADVFLAVQAGPAGSGFKKLMVVKRLRQNLAEEPEFVAMLVDEARIAARLNHPNVVQTNEVGHVDGQYFIAMEYLDGQPFHRIQHRAAQRAKTTGTSPLSQQQQYFILIDVLAGLHHAHELTDYDGTPLEIVHRDITPHNIFVTYAGQVKVVDFGIAKAQGRSSETRQGVVKGKVRYMAPEQAIGQNIDRRADLFSVGIMLWEIATGRRMWKDKDDLQIVQELVGGNLPPSPRTLVPTVPEEIDRICRKALAHKVEDRYATAEDFRSDLEEYMAKAGVLVEARRTLSPTLLELFADKREELKRVVEKQLASIDQETSGEFAALPMSFDSTSGPTSLPGEGSSADLAARKSLAELVPRSYTSTMTLRAEGEPSGLHTGRPALAPRIGVGVLAFLALGVGTFAAWRTTRPQAQETVVAPVEMPTATEPLSDVDAIVLTLNVEPEDAHVFVDDAPMSGGTARFSRDNLQHRLRVEAPDHETHHQLLEFSTERLDVDVKLDKKAPAEPVASTPTPKSPGARVVHHAPPATPKQNSTPSQPSQPATAAAAATPPPTPPPTTPTTPTQPAATQPTPPPAQVDLSAQYKRDVNRTIRQHAGELQACYDRAKMYQPNLAGVVSVGANVTQGGQVTSAGISNSTARSPRLESCIVERFRTWNFPPVPAGVQPHVSYTFRFE